MTNKVSWSITDQNIAVNFNGETYIVKRDSALSDRLIKAIKAQKWDEVPNLVSAAKRLETYSKGNFSVKNGQVMINNQPAPTALSNKILRFSDEGLPYKPLLKFAENLQQNPSFRAVSELFQFLEKNDHPITEKGYFIAYKRVKGDFTDIHSGTFDNSVGNVVEMPRNKVDEDCNRTCSYGLHVANWDYAHNQFASSNSRTDVMLEVEVNPADVVAVPSDYNQSKMRVCRYKVLGVVQNPYQGSSLKVVDKDVPLYDDDEEDNCCEGEKDYCGDCDCCDDEVCKSCVDTEEPECEFCCDDSCVVSDDFCICCNNLYTRRDCEHWEDYCEDCYNSYCDYTDSYCSADLRAKDASEDEYPYEDELE